MYEVDFDVSHEGYSLRKLRNQAARHGVIITKVNEIGPGGGNPQIFVQSHLLHRIMAFVCDVYGVTVGTPDFDDYVAPIMDHVRRF